MMAFIQRLKCPLYIIVEYTVHTEVMCVIYNRDEMSVSLTECYNCRLDQEPLCYIINS